MNSNRHRGLDIVAAIGLGAVLGLAGTLVSQASNAYPFLVLTFIGWIWSLLKGK